MKRKGEEEELCFAWEGSSARISRRTGLGSGSSLAMNDFFGLSSGDVGARCRNDERDVPDWLIGIFTEVGTGVGVVSVSPFSIVRAGLCSGLVGLDKEVPLSLLFVWLFMGLFMG